MSDTKPDGGEARREEAVRIFNEGARFTIDKIADLIAARTRLEVVVVDLSHDKAEIQAERDALAAVLRDLLIHPHANSGTRYVVGKIERALAQLDAPEKPSYNDQMRRAGIDPVTLDRIEPQEPASDEKFPKFSSKEES